MSSSCLLQALLNHFCSSALRISIFETTEPRTEQTDETESDKQKENDKTGDSELEPMAKERGFVEIDLIDFVKGESDIKNWCASVRYYLCPVACLFLYAASNVERDCMYSHEKW